MSSPSEFDGVDDYVQVPWARSLDLGAGDFTSTARIHYTDITGTRAILWAYRVGSGAPQIWLRAEPANKRLIATLGTGEGTATVTTPQAYNDGQWHDVVLRRAGGRLTLTVDGRTTSVTAPGGSVTEGKQFTIDGIDIGQRLDGLQRFHGSISDVRIYSRAVPDDELATARHGLRLWLPLDRIGGKG
jgi:sialidase-1